MANLKVSENPLPFLPFTETVDPSNPVAGGQRLFVDTDHLLKMVDSSGTVTTFTSGGLVDPMTTRGDIIIRNAANTTARLGRGSANQVLTSDGTDIAWAAPASTGMATDALWDAAGDLAQGTGANTGAKLSIGTTNYGLKVVAGSAAWGLPHAWGCMVSGTSTALTTAQYNSLAFGAADTYDPDNYHDPATNNTRLTVPTGLGGIYILSAMSTFPNTTNADTEERLTWRVNGGTDQNGWKRTRAATEMIVGTSSFIAGTTILQLAAADYVEIRQWVTNATSPQTTTSYHAEMFLVGVS